MNYFDAALEERDFTTVPMPFAIYCAKTTCQTIIRPGTPAKRFDGCTYVHVECPSYPRVHYAAHKAPDGGLRFGPRD